MTSTTDAPDPTDPTDSTEPNELHRADHRTGLLLVNDAVVVYDLEDPFGWIRSDVSVALAERR